VAVNLAIQLTTGGTAPAFGQIDTPAQGATGVVGAVGLTGWALDDIGVANVTVYRNCVAFENQANCQLIGGHNVVLLGPASFVSGARPDVAASFINLPDNQRAGWGMHILSNMLPHMPNMQTTGGQGTLSFYAFATDVEGQRTLLGRSYTDHTPTSLTMDNDHIAKPFGTIDTPGQGQTVSGMVANFGWALTPDTDVIGGNGDIVIPTDGSTMVVFIDGVPVANVAYNQCRGSVGNPVPGGQYCDDDVASIFGNVVPQPPGTPRVANPTIFRNLDAARGAIGSYVIDTTILADGLHSIAWSVTDSHGRVEGIGSRFLTVVNGGTVPAPEAAAPTLATALARPSQSMGRASRQPTRVSRSAVRARVGFDLARPWDLLARDAATSTARLVVAAGSRVELAFGREVAEAFLVSGLDLLALPVGSRLDSAAGVFTWQLPAAFHGTYELSFDTASGRVPVRLTVGDRP
jgi:hypothetical protein